MKKQLLLNPRWIKRVFLGKQFEIKNSRSTLTRWRSPVWSLRLSELWRVLAPAIRWRQRLRLRPHRSRLLSPPDISGLASALPWKSAVISSVIQILITSLWTGDLSSSKKKKIFFFLANVHSHSTHPPPPLLLRPQQQHIWYSAAVGGRAHRDREVSSRAARRSCREILTAWPFRCNINQEHLYWDWRIKLSEQYIGYLQHKVEPRRPGLRIPPGLGLHPSACPQFPQSCLRRCRECMRLSSVAHFTRWSDWIRCNSLYFHSHSPLGESKVPERFHAWDRGVAAARSPTTTTHTRPPHRRQPSPTRFLQRVWARSVPTAPADSVKTGTCQQSRKGETAAQLTRLNTQLTHNCHPLFKRSFRIGIR